jgi:CHAP domain
MSIWANVVEAWTVAREKFPAASAWLDDESVLAGRRVEAAAEGTTIGEVTRRAIAGGRHPTMDELALHALEVAITQIGCGEAGGNNCGPDVARYVAPARCPANWCGGFAGWCYEEAGRRLGMDIPFQRSLGAKKLGRNVAAVGRHFADPREARPGDLMVFHRGAQGSWQGHVAMIARADFNSSKIATIEGNAGPKVARMTRSVDRDRFAFFASLRRAP